MIRSKLRRRIRLKGWIRWTPFLVAPFAVLFGEIWMNIHLYHYAYEENRYREEFRETSQRIQALREEVATMEAIDRMRVAAPDLGLVEPRYQQIQIVRESGTNSGPATPVVEPGYQLAVTHAARAGETR